MTTRREPEDARTAPQAATTSTITTTNQTMAIHPYPLTPAPPYERRGDHRLHGRWGALGGRAAMPLRVERYLEAVWSSRCSSSWAASSIALCRHSAAR
jgi:hypothetical protein